MSAAPHDRLFRRLFADLGIAADAIRGVLPPEVAALVDFSHLEAMPTAHVDEALHATYADLVFRARIAGRDALLLLLVEHQSQPDALMPFRLLRYAVQTWDAFIRDHPNAERLPLILPIVFHQGPRRWTASNDMLSLIDLTPAEAKVLGRYVPRMGFELDDFGGTSDADLIARGMQPAATLGLSALRDVRNADDVPALVLRWTELIRDACATENGLAALRSIFLYIQQAHPDTSREELKRVLDSIVEGAGAEIMTTFREIMDLGRVEARRATLLELTRSKFRDAVTADAVARIQNADSTAVDRAIGRIFVAATVDDLFG